MTLVKNNAVMILPIMKTFMYSFCLVGYEGQTSQKYLPIRRLYFSSIFDTCNFAYLVFLYLIVLMSTQCIANHSSLGLTSFISITAHTRKRPRLQLLVILVDSLNLALFFINIEKSFFIRCIHMKSKTFS